MDPSIHSTKSKNSDKSLNKYVFVRKSENSESSRNESQSDTESELNILEAYRNEFLQHLKKNKQKKHMGKNFRGFITWGITYTDTKLFGVGTLHIFTSVHQWL